MHNLCSDNYPQIVTRKCRSRIVSNTKIISNMLSAKGGLIYIDSNGYLHYNGCATALEGVDSSTEYNLIQYGNNVVILPLKVFFNLSTEKVQNIEHVNSDIAFQNMYMPKEADTYNLIPIICSIRKTILGDKYNQQPDGINSKNNYDPITYFKQNDFSNWTLTNPLVNHLREDGYTRPSILYKCTAKKDTKPVFTEMESYYVRIRGTGIGSGLKTGDYVKISGMEHNIGEADESVIDNTSYIDVLNNNIFKLYGVDEDYIIIKADLEVSIPYCGEMSVSKVMPEADFDKMIEVNNRLWTCSSANNEIYACKQGDCTSWQAYSDGISTDSFAMTVGCEGDFTGIARQNDSVIFFKENWVLKIYGTKPSNYTLATYNVLGVEKGSSKSIVWINGVLYYLSKQGVCQYSPGSQPIVISEDAFGDMKYKNGVAGRHNNKYYISAENEDGEYELFVFDTDTGLWHKEDNTHMLSTVSYNNTMYYIDGNTGYVMCPDDKHNLIENSDSFEKEGAFDWSCETGDLYDSDFNTKYISRINIGVKNTEGTVFKVFAQFEDGGVWSELRTVRYDRKKPHTIPVAVRRSDFLRLRLEGKGQCEIYGIDIEYSQGSVKR